MVLQSICAPALIYLVFSMTQIVVDTVKGMYNIAFIKIWVTLLFTILLNFLCNKGLGIVSWIIVFIPFILMTIIVTLLLFMFGLDPITGRRPKIVGPNRNKKHKHHKHHKHHRHHKKGKPEYLPTKHNNIKGDNLKYSHRINSGYDESNISPDQRKVLTDKVQDRTGLVEDPLQKKQ